jgi:hypothetical protein
MEAGTILPPSPLCTGPLISLMPGTYKVELGPITSGLLISFCFYLFVEIIKIIDANYICKSSPEENKVKSSIFSAFNSSHLQR